MKRILVVLPILLILLVGCQTEVVIEDSISIVGDIHNSIDLLENINQYQSTEVEYGSESAFAIDFRDVIESLNPISSDFDIYFVSSDGFNIRLSGDSISDTYLVYSQNDKWLYFSDKHPRNSRIKSLSQIIISRNDTDITKGLTIIKGDNFSNFSIGQLYTKPYMTIAMLDGQTTQTVRDRDYSIDVMKQHRIIPLDVLVEGNPSTLLVASLLGDYEFIYLEDYYIQLSGSSINLINVSTGNIINEVIGIMYDPPSTSNLDVYDYVRSFLLNDEKTMVILVDGFSYYQYMDEVFENDEYFISQVSNIKKSTTVYKPVTNAGLAAILTGVSPKENGILNRSYREVKSETIFEMADKLGKESILIEGDTNILNLNVKTELNFDRNNDGFNEDEIYLSALSHIDEYDLLFVHFHSVDDAGHSYGPMDRKTLDRLKVVDEYIENLVAKWDGKVLIVSDHGMQVDGDAGYHGDFVTESMYVPLIILEGAK